MADRTGGGMRQDGTAPRNRAGGGAIGEFVARAAGGLVAAALAFGFILAFDAAMDLPAAGLIAILIVFSFIFGFMTVQTLNGGGDGAARGARQKTLRDLVRPFDVDRIDLRPGEDDPDDPLRLPVSGDVSQVLLVLVRPRTPPRKRSRQYHLAHIRDQLLGIDPKGVPLRAVVFADADRRFLSFVPARDLTELLAQPNLGDVEAWHAYLNGREAGSASRALALHPSTLALPDHATLTEAADALAQEAETGADPRYLAVLSKGRCRAVISSMELLRALAGR